MEWTILTLIAVIGALAHLWTKERGRVDLMSDRLAMLEGRTDEWRVTIPAIGWGAVSQVCLTANADALLQDLATKITERMKQEDVNTLTDLQAAIDEMLPEHVSAVIFLGKKHG